MVKVIITNESFQSIATRIKDKNDNAIILTLDNINEVAKRMGCVFIIDYHLIDARKFMSKFNIVVRKMISVWRHTDSKFIIIVHTMEKLDMYEGLARVEKSIRNYITVVSHTPSVPNPAS